jgi:hypothetical protein
MASTYGLIDVTFPVARFAQQRMAERFPKADSTPILPTNVNQVKAASQPDLLSKFIQAKIDHPEFMTDSLVLTMSTSMAVRVRRSILFAFSLLIFLVCRF